MYCVTILFLGIICVWATACYCRENENVIISSQRIRETYGGGKLCLLVETDKNIYDYHDYIYVTATLINTSDEDFWFAMNTSKRGVFQELEISLKKDDNQLLNVDTHKIQYENQKYMYCLKPGEKIIQTLRFSTIKYNNQLGRLVYAQNEPESGMYEGIVTAYILADEEIIPFSVLFELQID